MSLYTLETEEEKAVQAIFDKLPSDEVTKKLRSALEDVTQTVCDSLLDYMHDSYRCQFDEIILRQARKIVEALLRGENLDAFGLKARTFLNKDELYAYDGAKVRESLVRDFASEIQTAEIIELRKENESLKQSIKIYRDRY
jgi:hypothetical protein